MIPVLKANAYGHGAVAVARVLEPLGVAMFAVAYVDEAIALRQAGTHHPPAGPDRFRAGATERRS